MNSDIVVTRQESSPLSTEQYEFAALVDQAKSLADKISAMRALVDQHRVTFWGIVRPLQVRQAGLKRATIIMLDEKLSVEGLTAKQLRQIKRIICRTAKEFALKGDEEMRLLHDKHSEETLAELEKSQADEARSYFEQMMGEELDDEDEFENVDDVLHASIERMRKQAEAREKAKEKRRKRAGKSAIENGLAEDDFDTKASLRAIYRQLASALHPDRETDPVKRLYKTSLMSEANTAYEQHDLFTLLQLQTKANLTEQQITASLSVEKIPALISLLEHRIQLLKRTLRDIEIETVAEFVLPSAVSITAPSLKSHLKKTQLDLMSNITDLKADMVNMSSRIGLKRWLREQEELI